MYTEKYLKSTFRKKSTPLCFYFQKTVKYLKVHTEKYLLILDKSTGIRWYLSFSSIFNKNQKKNCVRIVNYNLI